MAARALGLGKPEGQGIKYVDLCAKSAVYPPLIMITCAKKYHLANFNCGQTGGMSAKSVLSSGMLGAKVRKDLLHINFNLKTL